MIEWDQAKSDRCLRERGFTFETASLIFEGRTLEIDDNRSDYGERRIQAFGEVEGVLLAVVYTWRGSRRRIISARLASRRERNAYRQKILGETRED